jgi:3'-phosphoadenosine 5'-phosphosulfate (PAPS) 3'-phosphatase
MNRDCLIPAASRLVREAGIAVLEHYGTDVERWGSADSPVTAADRAADEIIVGGLRIGNSKAQHGRKAKQGRDES